MAEFTSQKTNLPEASGNAVDEKGERGISRLMISGNARRREMLSFPALGASGAQFGLLPI
jgi:hypothetical protein